MVKIIFKMSESEFRDRAEEFEGMCLVCGESRDCVEPDACKYECYSCEQHAVYGMEELLIMGCIEISDEDSDDIDNE